MADESGNSQKYDFKSALKTWHQLRLRSSEPVPRKNIFSTRCPCLSSGTGFWNLTSSLRGIAASSCFLSSSKVRSSRCACSIWSHRSFSCLMSPMARDWYPPRRIFSFFSILAALLASVVMWPLLICQEEHKSCFKLSRTWKSRGKKKIVKMHLWNCVELIKFFDFYLKKKSYCTFCNNLDFLIKTFIIHIIHL